jgi:hypothetical protein
MVSIVLSTAVSIYPSVTTQYTADMSKIYGGFKQEQTVADAVNALIIAEKTTSGSAGQSEARRQVHGVSHYAPQASGRCGNRKQQGGRGQGWQKKQRSGEDAIRKRRDDIAERECNSVGNNCGEKGHWWKECPHPNRGERGGLGSVWSIQSMMCTVIFQCQAELEGTLDAPPLVHSAREGRRQVSIVESTPTWIDRSRQRMDSCMYSTTYTRRTSW